MGRQGLRTVRKKMNSNLNRALAAALVSFGGVAPALAQFDWDGICIDPNSTQPYSNDFITAGKENALFGAALGFAGTVAYGSQCEGASVPVRGRIAFTIGYRGSIQDNQGTGFNGVNDEFMRLTRGTNFSEDPIPTNSYPGPYYTHTGGGLSYARIVVQTQNATTGQPDAPTDYLYGSNPLRLAFAGPRSRFIYSESTVNGTASNASIGVRCIIDVLGDAARVNWRLTNNLAGSPTVGLGLWFGQVVELRDKFGALQYVFYGPQESGFPAGLVTIPGRKPLSVQERFNETGLSPNGGAGGATLGVPAYVNFSASQAAGFGLQVVNRPDALQGFDPNSTIDQSPVDEFVLGEAPFLIDGRYGTADPTFGDFIFNANGNGNADAAEITPIPAYLQKWQPTTLVAGGNFRDIVAYYRSTNGDSSYSPSFQGYAAVVDTPKSISTDPSDPNALNPNPFTIRVNIDNNGGFSNNDREIAMSDVRVVLNLPNGMHAPNDPRAQTIEKFVRKVYNFDQEINSATIQPSQVGFVDFQVEVDSTVFGALPYTVSITPQPGFATKTVTGTINVATSPKLQIISGPNLVSPPWQFADNGWESVLGLDLNGDFRAYTWNNVTQSYVPQTAAERGIGTWILSNDGYGFKSLGGSPRQPDDQFPDRGTGVPGTGNYDAGGAPLVRLRRGWNLVGNPYNYAIQLGQIIAVPTGTTSVLSYDELVAQNYTDGAFTYYDQSLRTYGPATQGANARLQPNRGYWIYANFDFDLKFPPIYELFIRSAEPKPQPQRYNNWRLQLSASTSSGSDLNNFVGIVRNPKDSTKLSARKAPISPASNAMRAYISDGTRDMAQLLKSSTGKQTFTYNVLTKAAGPVSISWPNLKELPSNLAVSVYDPVAKKTINARSVAGYNYNSTAQSIRSFTVTVTPQGTVAQSVGSASTTQYQAGSVKLMKISYFLGGRGSATIRVYKGRTLVGTAASDVNAVPGTNSVVWPMIGSNGLPLENGNYTLEIAATGEGGNTATRQLAVTIRR